MSKRASRRAKVKLNERRQAYEKVENPVTKHGMRRPGTQNPRR